MYFDFETWRRVASLIAAEPFRLKRAFFLWGVFSGLSLLSVINMICIFLDPFLFPKLREQEVEAPIFIVGNGRSGTTHIHRILSADGDRFSFFKTWELLLPSVLQHAWSTDSTRLTDASWEGWCVEGGRRARTVLWRTFVSCMIGSPQVPKKMTSSCLRIGVR
jgi:hypothetical protein